jgi:hypothetical protein
MSSLGNLVMFIAGLGYSQGAIEVMIAGRIIMGLGVGEYPGVFVLSAVAPDSSLLLSHKSDV